MIINKREFIQMTQTNQLKNEAITLAIANWLTDPELVDWLQQAWHQPDVSQIQKSLKLLRNQLILDLEHNQIILVNLNQSTFLIGVDVKNLLLWTKQTERIGSVVLHTIPDWHKSAFEFYK